MKLKESHFLTSDTHFWHKNIIRYCNRPWHSGSNGDGELVVSDDDVHNMTEALVEKWNSVVGVDDVVWHLGDFAFFRRSQWERASELINRLNGEKVLVLGNHDRRISEHTSFWRDLGFSEVYDHPVVCNKFFVLSHEPLEFLSPNLPFCNIFGHVHDSEPWRTFTRNSCCVCVERWDYTPVRLETIKVEWEREVGQD